MTPEYIQNLIDDAVKLYDIHVVNDPKSPLYEPYLKDAYRRIANFYNMHWHTLTYIQDYVCGEHTGNTYEAHDE